MVLQRCRSANLTHTTDSTKLLVCRLGNQSNLQTRDDKRTRVIQLAFHSMGNSLGRIREKVFIKASRFCYARKGSSKPDHAQCRWYSDKGNPPHHAVCQYQHMRNICMSLLPFCFTTIGIHTIYHHLFVSSQPGDLSIQLNERLLYSDLKDFISSTTFSTMSSTM